MQKAAQAYLQTQVATTSQGALLLMLYDGAVNFLNQAKEKIAERDYAKKGILISKAIDIVAELDACLNVQRGGDISDNLHRLYFYCNSRLLSANLKMNVAYIDEVIKILEGLRSAYAHILSPGDDAAAKSRLGAQAGAGEMSQTTSSVSGVSANAQAQQVMNEYASMQPQGGQHAAAGSDHGNVAQYRPVQANPGQAYPSGFGQANLGQANTSQSNFGKIAGYGRSAGASSFGSSPVSGEAPVASNSAPAAPEQGMAAPVDQVSPATAAVVNSETIQSAVPVGSGENVAESPESTQEAKPTGQQGFARNNAANMYKRLSGQL